MDDSKYRTAYDLFNNARSILQCLLGVELLPWFFAMITVTQNSPPTHASILELMPRLPKSAQFCPGGSLMLPQQRSVDSAIVRITLRFLGYSVYHGSTEGKQS